MKNILLLCLAILLISSCKKTEDVKIPGNVPPPDHTIDSTTIVLYVNKCYINMLGRKPIGNEQSDAVATLRASNFSVNNRKQFLQTLFTKTEYNRNLYVVADNQYLRSTDSATIAGQIALFQYLITQPQYTSYVTQIQFEMARLDTLQNVINYMNAGQMDYKGMLKRVANNYFYDQINMGTENFVVSTYQNFLFRYPTASELSDAENMVNGLLSECFLHSGQSKEDYVRIFFNTADYYEGQVRFIFRQYLFREPTSAEMGYYSNIYQSSGDYKQLQLAVFSLDEFAGV